MMDRRRLWQHGLRLRFTLLHRHRYRHLVLELVNGRHFVVLP